MEADIPRIDIEVLRAGGTFCYSAAYRAYKAEEPTLTEATEAVRAGAIRAAGAMTKDEIYAEIGHILTGPVSLFTKPELVHAYARRHVNTSVPGKRLAELRTAAKAEREFAEWVNSALDTADRLAGGMRDRLTGVPSTDMAHALHAISRDHGATLAVADLARRVVNLTLKENGKDLHEAAQSVLHDALTDVMYYPRHVLTNGAGFLDADELFRALAAREFIRKTVRLLRLETVHAALLF